MNCAKCHKDVANKVLKVKLGNATYCMMCYQQIPYEDKKQMIEGD